jgi:hypothetical protein
MLEGAERESADAHVASCGDCASWERRAELLQGTLSALPRVEAPAELEDRVGLALTPEGRRERVLYAVSSLERPQVPAELDERVLGEAVRAELEASEATRRISALGRLAAPAVLDRLVAEELVDPAASRARRFAGDLERVEAPPALDESLADGIGTEAAGGRVIPLQRRVRQAAPWVAGLAAAVLLLVLAPRGSEPAEPEPVWSFEVVHADSAAALPGEGTLARALVDGISGGVLSALGEAR